MKHQHISFAKLHGSEAVHFISETENCTLLRSIFQPDLGPAVKDCKHSGHSGVNNVCSRLIQTGLKLL